MGTGINQQWDTLPKNAIGQEEWNLYYNGW